MTFGDTVDLDTARTMVDTALDAGITSLDTANGYAAGAARRCSARSSPAGVTPRRSRPRPASTRATPATRRCSRPPGLRSSLEASLRRLRTDHVDVYYLHQPDRSVADRRDRLLPWAELVEEGKVRAIGVSNFSAWQIGDVFAACDALGTPRPVLAQQLYNLVARRIEAEYAEFATTQGLATIVYNPLGGGLLTGRHSLHASRRPRAASARRPCRRCTGTATGTPRRSRSSRPSAPSPSEAGISLPELSLRWLLYRGPCHVGAARGFQTTTSWRPTSLLHKPARSPPTSSPRATRQAWPSPGPMPGYNR